MLWFVVLCLVAIVVWTVKAKKLALKYRRVVRDGLVISLG